jgi:hypothetical protein
VNLRGFRTQGNRTTAPPIPAGDLVNLRGFRTHGNRTAPHADPRRGSCQSAWLPNPRKSYDAASRSPQGILSICVASEPTEMVRRAPDPRRDLVNSRGFRTHVNRTEPIPIPAGDLVNLRGVRTHGNRTAPHADPRRGSCQSAWLPNPRKSYDAAPDPRRESCQSAWVPNPTEIVRRCKPIPAADLVNLRGVRTHGNRTKRNPIPAGDLVNLRGFRIHLP